MSLDNPALDTLWLDPGHGLIARIERARARLGAPAERTIVLLPYAQLLPLAQRLWARTFPRGFAPRFETTMSWAHSLAPAAAPGPDSIVFEAARDGLTAQALLHDAGLGAQAGALAARLVEAAHEIAQRVAAIAPSERDAWAGTARAALQAGLEQPALEAEAALARIALEWALATDHATDRLWAALQAFDPDGALITVVGLNADPLSTALCARCGARAEAIALAEPRPAPPAAVAVHPACDAEDEAERAAACVLRHLLADRVPVALAATERPLTRRVRALLATRSVAIRDETGWALSTTRAASHAMGALRAAAIGASCDTVLDWIKHCPAFDPAAQRRLERALRRAGAAQWAGWQAVCTAPRADELVDAAALDLTRRVDRLLARLGSPRPLARWLAALRELLSDSGQWALLEADAAGHLVLETLQLCDDAPARCAAALHDSVWATRRMGLSAFADWVADALESARYVPPAPDDAQVVILPLAQLFARPYPALVLPGCDERRLNAAPEPGRAFGTAQREALGLPTREQLAQSQRTAWAHALATPHIDLLWRASDAGGEPLAPSPLLQQLLLARGACAADADPRTVRIVAAEPTQPSQPSAAELVVPELSASAYESLRRCPYQFFALRQLGLQEAGEIETELDKRDWGNWLHRALKLFHEALNAPQAQTAAAPLAVFEAAAQQATAELGLAPDEFLPFAAAWPAARDGYLAWFQAHRASAATWQAGEAEREQRLGGVLLKGRIDRIDRLPDGTALLIDYKTESVERTRQRVKEPAEDMQLAFYGALLADDTFAAAYLNVGERTTTRHDQPDAVAWRDALVQGIRSDLERIAAGAPLPALGTGSACDWCAARGLCRKDFWR